MAAPQFSFVATCGYISCMPRKTTGIRELRNNLSRIIRSLRPGEVIAVTDRGELVAELRGAPGARESMSPMLQRYEHLVATGAIRPAAARSASRGRWGAGVSLPAGTAKRLIDADRDG
jgi:antitoxin (DNA-binding transcriptional repressor) of toxin-antitoxin stability system